MVQLRDDVPSERVKHVGEKRPRKIKAKDKGVVVHWDALNMIAVVELQGPRKSYFQVVIESH